MNTYQRRYSELAEDFSLSSLSSVSSTNTSYLEGENLGEDDLNVDEVLNMSDLNISFDDDYQKQLNVMKSLAASPRSLIEEMHQEKAKKDMVNRKTLATSTLTKPDRELPTPTDLVQSYFLGGWTSTQNRKVDTVEKKVYANKPTKSTKKIQKTNDVDQSFDSAVTDAFATVVTGGTKETGRSMYTTYTGGSGTTKHHKNGVEAMMKKKMKKRNGRNGRGRDSSRGNDEIDEDLMNMALVLPRSFVSDVDGTHRTFATKRVVTHRQLKGVVSKAEEIQESTPKRKYMSTPGIRVDRNSVYTTISKVPEGKVSKDDTSLEKLIENVFECCKVGAL